MGKDGPKAPAAPDPVASARASQLSYYGPGGEGLQYGYVNPYTGGFMNDADFESYNKNLNQGIQQWLPGTPARYDDGALIPGTGRQTLNPNWKNPLDKNKLTSAYKAIENPYQSQTRGAGEDITSSILKALQSQGLAQVPNQLDYSEFDKIPSMQDYEGLRSSSERSAFDRSKALLDPVFAERRKSSEQSLANRGLPTGSEVSNAEVDDLGRQENQALQQVAEYATQFGSSEAQNALSAAMQRRQQQIADKMQNVQLGTSLRQQQLGEIGAITGMPFAQTPTQPQYIPGVQEGINRQYQGQMANYQQGNQNRSNLFSSLASLGLGIGSAGTSSIFGRMFG